VHLFCHVEIIYNFNSAKSAVLKQGRYCSLGVILKDKVVKKTKGVIGDKKQRGKTLNDQLFNFTRLRNANNQLLGFLITYLLNNMITWSKYNITV